MSPIVPVRLPSCPGKPNCVCSDDPQGSHHVPAFRLRRSDASASARGDAGTGGDAGAIAAAVAASVGGLPGARVTSVGSARVAVEFRSRAFGFVDDLLLEVRPERGEIAVRSAARLGWWDFGVNRRRVETIRTRLRAIGIVE
jgi:uncharacterized protein (DUF1499 family)